MTMQSIAIAIILTLSCTMAQSVVEWQYRNISNMSGFAVNYGRHTYFIPDSSRGKITSESELEDLLRSRIEPSIQLTAFKDNADWNFFLCADTIKLSQARPEMADALKFVIISHVQISSYYTNPDNPALNELESRNREILFPLSDTLFSLSYIIPNQVITDVNCR